MDKRDVDYHVISKWSSSQHGASDNYKFKE